MLLGPVRTEAIRESDGGTREMFVGGMLATLLYTVQLGAVSYDPWHSRVGRLEYADYTVIDLDPGPGALFQTVVDVARWVKDELDSFGLRGALKTSGSSGLHIYLPLPPATPLEAATLVAQIIATKVAASSPEARDRSQTDGAAAERHRVCRLPAEPAGEDDRGRVRRPCQTGCHSLRSAVVEGTHKRSEHLRLYPSIHATAGGGTRRSMAPRDGSSERSVAPAAARLNQHQAAPDHPLLPCSPALFVSASCTGG